MAWPACMLVMVFGLRAAMHLGGFCFHHLTVITFPKAYNVLLRRRAWAFELSASWKETTKEDVAPALYMDGSRTHEGFWVMVRAA